MAEYLDEEGLTEVVNSMKAYADSKLGSTGTTGGSTASIALASSSNDGLMSSSDFTKLAGIETGAQLNKIETINYNGSTLPITNKAVTIPNASSSSSTDTITSIKLGSKSLTISNGSVTIPNSSIYSDGYLSSTNFKLFYPTIKCFYDNTDTQGYFSSTTFKRLGFSDGVDLEDNSALNSTTIDMAGYYIFLCTLNIDLSEFTGNFIAGIAVDSIVLANSRITLAKYQIDSTESWVLTIIGGVRKTTDTSESVSLAIGASTSSGTYRISQRNLIIAKI